MLDLALGVPRDDVPLVLFIGAHCDDIEIGCGGTVQWLLQQYPAVDVRWMVLSAHGARADEARRGAAAFLGDDRADHVILGSFRDGFLPYEGRAVKEFFESVKADLTPDLVFTHTGNDAHQDHRLACELTWNTWRDSCVLEYEIPKWDGDLAARNTYVPLTQRQIDTKIERLFDVYGTQRSKDWFDAEVFRGLARLRGMECRAPAGYAEAFTARKLLLGGPAR